MLTTSSLAAAQTDQEKAAARSLATQGGQALAGNRYAEALDLVTRAEAIMHAPTHLLMIARSQVGVGKFVAAQETYLKLIREELPASAPQAFRNAQAEAKTELAAVEPKIANVRVLVEHAQGQKVTLKIDNQSVPDALVGVYAPVDPGHHVLVASAGGASGQTTVDVAQGERKDVPIPLVAGAAGVADTTTAGTDAAAPRGFFTPLRIAGIAIGAAGVGGVVLGTIMIIGKGSSQTSGDNLFASCHLHGCSATQQSQIQSDDDAAASKGTIAVIGFAAGGAAIAAGATLVLIGGPKKAASSETGVRPYFTGTSGGLTGAF